VDEEGQIQYFGSFTEQMPMNIKIKKTGTFVEIVKNDVGGISREYTDPLTFRPIISPVFAGDKITRVTANVGVPLQTIATARPSSCEGNTKGSIALDVRGGQPPYHFNWSNGDTTSTPDSLDVGLYSVQIWDAQLDTIVDSIYIGYGMDWDTTFNVGDTLGMLISTGNNSTESFDSYAYALNSLAPGEDGWVEFEIPQNTVYNGAMAMNANKHYDETTEGIGINIVNGYIIVRGSMISGNTIMAPYKQAAGYRFRIEFNGSNIDVIYKDLLGLAPGRKISVNYTRTQAWSPTIIFGLNGAKISSISSSFGCGGMHADVQLSPAAKDGTTGSIYSQVKGGYPPYTYAWSNSSSSANLANVPIGNYSLTVQDQSGATQVVSTFLGRYTDWDVLSGMAEVGNGVVYEGDTVDFDSTIVSFAIARNAIKPSASGTVSFDFEKAGDFVGAVGLSESADLSGSQDGALAVVGLIDGDLYILDENGDPAFFGKLRENLPVNILVYKTPTDFTITKNNLSSIIINRATTGYLSPVVIPGLPGDKVQRVTCDFGRKLSVKPVVTPIACGATNTGSITAQVIGGIPPYRYHWNTGDTTDVNDSLTIGSYMVTVTDSIGDSAVANITMGYGATWGSLVGVTVDGTNSLSPTLPFAGSAYAVGASTLYPIVGESGWMEFKVDAGVPFEGYFGLVNDMTFDENMVGLGILINDGHIYSSDTDPENENMYLGRYNQAVENEIRITKIADDEIEITVNGIVVLESEYEYPNTFKPVVYLNNDKSKVRSLVSSFCNTYADELLVKAKILNVSSKHKGSIYLDVEGGTPPYAYVWSDIVVPEDSVIDDELDSLIAIHSYMGLPTTGLKERFKKGVFANSNRQGLLAGSYSVTVTDAMNRQLTSAYIIGEVSKFMYTSTLVNELGTITKVGTDSWTNNVCISSLSSNAVGTPFFDFVVSEGDFDFGYRNLGDTVVSDSVPTFLEPEHLASEYYFIKIRSGMLHYVSSHGTSMTNLVSVNASDKISMYINASNVIIRKNDAVVYSSDRASSSVYELYSCARIYSEG
ncbi:MAG: SprB repeat-containing protein, partial [Bacteroidetes bacterium]|nr:SprB repeat-containing protein [Bacteroidota bacterium]